VEQDRPGCLNRSRSPPVSRPTQASRATDEQRRPRLTDSPPVVEPTCRGPTRAHFHRRIYKSSTLAAKSLLPSSVFTHRRAPCRHRSTPVSQSSSPPLIVSFRPENPLELTMLLPLFLQPELHPSIPYTGSHRWLPPVVGELLPLCFSSPARPCLTYMVLLCS
jgi:hypothetical protein